MEKSEIGVYGLGVMGRNIALNLNENGYKVSAFNKKLSGEENTVDHFLAGEAEGTDIKGYQDIDTFVGSLNKPRVILLMVKAGPPVDEVVSELTPGLDEGDIIVDGGNSHYSDTGRRLKKLAPKGIRYIGMGISGGEKGARLGPSMMPGGDKDAWPRLKPIFQSIAAKAGGTPCCKWMGPEGAGHFVKMVHNGIEYAIMQLIAECYHLMSVTQNMTNTEIADTFDTWNSGRLESYLLQISAEILSTKEDDNTFIIDLILDKAGQKGTGRWTALTALQMGIPLPLITEAVFARTSSSFKDLRQQISQEYDETIDGDHHNFAVVKDFQDAMLCAKSIAFAEGFWLLDAANKQFGWNISLADVAKVWQDGCIIRSSMLEPIVEAYEEDPDLPHLLLAPEFKTMITDLQQHWRSSVSYATQSSIPVPALMASLAHFDSLSTRRLPANMIQAQRDYFGAHTYERVDQPRGRFFHTDWQAKKKE